MPKPRKRQLGGLLSLETPAKTGGRKKRKSSAAPRKRYLQNGTGFLSDAWNGIKKVAGPVHDFVKKTGLISKGLAFVPGVGNVASGVAKALGYGKKNKLRGAGRIVRLMPHGAVPKIDKKIEGAGRKRKVYLQN